MELFPKKMAMMLPTQLLPIQNKTTPRNNGMQQKQGHQNLRHPKLKKFLLKSRVQPNLSRKNRNKKAATNSKKNKN
jgi:hypothetical protein